MIFHEGQRVVFTANHDVAQWALVCKGETGTIVTYDPDCDDGNVIMAVKLDTHHDGLTEWDNEVVWTDDDVATGCHPGDTLEGIPS